MNWPAGRKESSNQADNQAPTLPPPPVRGARLAAVQSATTAATKTSTVQPVIRTVHLPECRQNVKWTASIVHAANSANAAVPSDSRSAAAKPRPGSPSQLAADSPSPWLSTLAVSTAPTPANARAQPSSETRRRSAIHQTPLGGPRKGVRRRCPLPALPLHRGRVGWGKGASHNGARPLLLGPKALWRITSFFDMTLAGERGEAPQNFHFRMSDGATEAQMNRPAPPAADFR